MGLLLAGKTGHCLTDESKHVQCLLQTHRPLSKSRPRQESPDTVGVISLG